MNESIFKAGAGDFDVDQIVQEIQTDVARKTENGAYTDARITRAEQTNLVHMKDNKEFLDYYMACVSRATNVDIRAFEIPDRSGGFRGKIMVKVKQTIWHMLKFYTYRMWTQQNQINGLLSTALRTVRDHGDDQTEALEKRVRQLEQALEAARIDIPDAEDDNPPAPGS